MEERDSGRFDRFVRTFGGGFMRRQYPLVCEGKRLRGSIAGMAVATPEALPENFICLEVGEADYLFMLAARAKVGVLEIGRRNGGSTFLMACANNKVPVISIDKAPVDDERLLYLCASHGVANVALRVEESIASPYDGCFDLLFVDADHSYDACLADLNKWAPRLPPGGHVAIHDCRYKADVVDATEAFLDTHPDFYAVRGPYIPSGGYHEWGGAMAHLRRSPHARS